MKLVVIIGPQAVGKMTVGQELQKKTGLKLFHNHMTIDLVSNFFSYGSPEGKRLVKLFRKEIFEEVAKSNLKGMIFTYMCDFSDREDWDYLEWLYEPFSANNADIYFVELEASVDLRLERNKTENCLLNKPTKRDLAFSENDIIDSMNKYRLNSYEGEIKKENYVRIDNTDLSPESVANLIVEKFQL